MFNRYQSISLRSTSKFASCPVEPHIVVGISSMSARGKRTSLRSTPSNQRISKKVRKYTLVLAPAGESQFIVWLVLPSYEMQGPQSAGIARGSAARRFGFQK